MSDVCSTYDDTQIRLRCYTCRLARENCRDGRVFGKIILIVPIISVIIAIIVAIIIIVISPVIVSSASIVVLPTLYVP